MTTNNPQSNRFDNLTEEERQWLSRFVRDEIRRLLKKVARLLRITNIFWIGNIIAGHKVLLLAKKKENKNNDCPDGA